MRNQPRNLLGTEQQWSGLVPGLGLMNYILGWFTVPVEALLRRDFGERYFTRANFFAGLLLLVLWNLATSLLSFLNPLMYMGGGTPASSSMRWFIWLFVIASAYHFLRIWWNDVTGQPVHSYSAGRSWLRPLGKGIMALFNLFLNGIVRAIMSATGKGNPEKSLPVLQDVNTFTERFVEPFVVLILALFFFGWGNAALGAWLLFSVMALNLYTGLRHTAERSIFLDYRDQYLEAAFMKRVQAGDENAPGPEGLRRVVKETAAEIERNPEVLSTIEQQNPSLAQAMAALNPQLKRVVTSPPTEEQKAL